MTRESEIVRGQIAKAKVIPIDATKTNGSAPMGKLSIPRLSDIQTMETITRPWFYGSFLTSGAFLITGRPKVGKSWLLMQLAIYAAQGQDFLGFESGGPESSLYIACEDDYARIKMRAGAFGGMPAEVKVLIRTQLMEFATQYSEQYTFAEFLREYLKQDSRIKLVFIDTEEACRQIWAHASMNVIAQQRSPTRKDYAEVVEFDKLGLELGVFIGLVNHAGKRKNGQSIVDYHEMINRTNTAAAAASGSFVIADPPGYDPNDTESRTRVFAVRGRDLSKEYLLAIEQPEGKSYFVSRGTYSEHRQTITETAILEALEAYPVETWVTSKDLAGDCGFAAGNVKRCISRMMKAGRAAYKTFFVETKPKKGIRLISKD